MSTGFYFVLSSALGLVGALILLFPLLSLSAGLLSLSFVLRDFSLVAIFFLLGSFAAAAQGLRVASQKKENDEWQQISYLGCAAIGIFAVLFTLGYLYDFLEAARNRREVNEFCTTRGILKSNVTNSVSTEGLRFTPSSCMEHSRNPLCNAAEDPVLSAPELLAAGHAFIEYEKPYSTYFRKLSGTSIARLYLTRRPDSRCELFDSRLSNNPNIARQQLEAMGVVKGSCIATTFEDASRSEYQILLTTKADPPSSRKYQLRAVLRRVSDSKELAEVESVFWEGDDVSKGLWCRNGAEFLKLLALVVPNSQSK